MMKTWLNDTWGSVGPGIWQGKEMMIVTTAAGGESTYGESGRIGVSTADVFTPMKASALHAGMTWLPRWLLRMPAAAGFLSTSASWWKG